MRQIDEKGYTERITNNIRHLHREGGFSRQKLADEFNVTEKAFSSYLEGRASPKIVTLVKIADFYGLTIDEIVREDLATSVKLVTIIKTIKTVCDGNKK